MPPAVNLQWGVLLVLYTYGDILSLGIDCGSDILALAEPDAKRMWRAHTMLSELLAASPSLSW